MLPGGAGAPHAGFSAPAPSPGRCSASTAKSLLFRFLPILRWLPRYPVKDWLLGDIASGFSVGIMHLPQGERGVPGLCPSRGFPHSRGLGLTHP